MTVKTNHYHKQISYSQAIIFVFLNTELLTVASPSTFLLYHHKLKSSALTVGNYTEMARYHLVLADWQELRKNANKPDFITSFDDTSDQLSIGNLIKTFQDMINTDVIR